MARNGIVNWLIVKLCTSLCRRVPCIPPLSSGTSCGLCGYITLNVDPGMWPFYEKGWTVPRVALWHSAFKSIDSGRRLLFCANISAGGRRRGVSYSSFPLQFQSQMWSGCFFFSASLIHWFKFGLSPASGPRLNSQETPEGDCQNSVLFSFLFCLKMVWPHPPLSLSLLSF